MGFLRRVRHGALCLQSTLGSHCDSEPAEIPLITSIEQADDRWKGVSAPGRVEQQQQDNRGSRVLQLCHVLSDKSGSDLAKGGTKKKGKELQPRTYRAEVKGIEGVVGKEGILRRVLERSLIETERWSRRSSETKIVPLVAR